MLLDHARGLSAENVEGKQALEELCREHAKSTKHQMDEAINKEFVLEQAHDELKKLNETSVRSNVEKVEELKMTLFKAETDAAIKLEAAARQHLEGKRSDAARMGQGTGGTETEI